jgi:hypothetical protein
MAQRSSARSAAPVAAGRSRWSAGDLPAWIGVGLPRLLITLAVAVVAAGQLAEDIADSEPLQLLSPSDSVRRWTVIAAVAYMLVISRYVDRMVDRSMSALREVIEIDPDRFERYAIGLGRLSRTFEAGLLIAAAVVVVVIFPVLGSSLPIDDPVSGALTHLPPLGIDAGLILAAYAVLGWAVVSMVTSTLRRARALGQLTREPLEVDVFDTSPLLPLGNIALATALAPAGIIVILVFGFGRPNEALSWTVLLLATSASIFALILPLRGIHRQMARAKQRVLSSLGARIRQTYVEADSDAGAAADQAETARLNNRISALIALRKTVGEMTTWPFRDTLAFGRAVLIASAPLIYTVISELIKVFWINPLAG